MGAQVHITKAKDWLEASQKRIGLREWIRVVETEQDLQLETPIAQQPAAEGPVVLPEEPGVAVWKQDDDRKVLFEYHHGQVRLEAEDEVALAKAKQLAEKLQARVLNDAGEEC